ncbi:MAG: BamA/TamA family outer membrane protein [Spirochaetales bacterium]|nr:BamA/TamA family outer membrane protein [Spirochaetales bacterium]
MLKKIIFFLLIIPCTGLSALTLESIQIEGNLKKTERETILNIIQYKEGDEISPMKLDKIEQRLLKSELFTNETVSVTLDIKDKEADLLIYADERFSFIIIPLVGYANNEFSGSIYLYEMNFLGSGNELLAGGTYSKSYQSGGIRFTNKYIGGSPFDLGARIFYDNQEVTITDLKGRDIESFDKMIMEGGLFSTWDADPFWVTVGVNGGVYSNADRKNNGGIRTSIDLGLDLTTQEEFFRKGFDLRGTYNFGLDIGNTDLFYLVSSDTSWSGLWGRRIQYSLQGKSQFYRGDIINAPSPGSLILAETIRAEEVYELVAGIDFLLFKTRGLYMTLPLTYSAGYLNGFSSEGDLFYGPGFGLSLNFRKAAAPPLTVQCGFNQNENTYRISIYSAFNF